MKGARALALLLLVAYGVVGGHGADYRRFQKKAQQRSASQVWRESRERASEGRANPSHASAGKRQIVVDDDGSTRQELSIEQARANIESATNDKDRSDAMVDLAFLVVDLEKDPVQATRLLDQAIALDPEDVQKQRLMSSAISKLLDYAIIHPYHGFNHTVVEEAVLRTTGPRFQFMNPRLKIEMGPKNEEVFMVVQLWQLYLRAVDFDSKMPDGPEKVDNEALTRQLMLNLLRAGLKADVLFNWGFQRNVNSQGGTPLGYLANHRQDIELFKAFVEAGHLLDSSVYGAQHRALDQLAQVPAEYYRVLKERSSHGVSVVHFLANGAASVIYMRNIYKAYNNHVAQGIPFFDALAAQKIDRFWPYSQTLSDLFHKIDEGAALFDSNLTKDVLSKSDTELEVSMLEMLFKRSDFLIEDHLSLSVPDNFSPLQMAAGMNRAGTARAIREHCAEQLQRFPQRAAAIKSAVRTALEAKTTYAGRSALHNAALINGQDSNVFRELIALEELVTDDSSFLRTDFFDDLGKTPFDYDQRINIWTPYSDETNAFLEAAQTKRPNVNFDYTEGESGGWGVVEDPIVDEDLDLAPDYCDLLEFDGIPSPEIMAVLMERNEPAVFRGAVKDWLIRDVWRFEPFYQKFANRTISVSAIPYQERFDEATPDVKVEMRVQDYLATWNSDAERFETEEAPRYLFSATLALKYDDIMDDVVDLTNLLDSFYYETSHMGKQFYFGPRYTGAPMHYHNTAINALAYGRKRWFMTPPNQTFYSIKATKQLWKDDLSALKKNSSLMQCIQHAGDLMFVGSGWGHATLNEQASIGFAMEWMDQRLSAAVSIPPFQEDLDYDRSQYTHDRHGPFGDMDKMFATGGAGKPLPPSEAGTLQQGQKCSSLKECGAGLVCQDSRDMHVLNKEQRCHGNCLCEVYNSDPIMVAAL
eukprot:INCI902.1.p1 GENE.INCI902.1~~INCI902.1.p1  ORF type:complete len:927 (+),score=174.88 INCI902.1:53-2833(+)